MAKINRNENWFVQSAVRGGLFSHAYRKRLSRTRSNHLRYESRIGQGAENHRQPHSVPDEALSISNWKLRSVWISMWVRRMRIGEVDRDAVAGKAFDHFTFHTRAVAPTKAIFSTAR